MYIYDYMELYGISSTCRYTYHPRSIRIPENCNLENCDVIKVLTEVLEDEESCKEVKTIKLPLDYLRVVVKKWALFNIRILLLIFLETLTSTYIHIGMPSCRFDADDLFLKLFLMRTYSLKFL